MATFITHYPDNERVRRNPEHGSYILVFLAVLLALCLLFCSSGCMYHGRLGELVKLGASSITSCLCPCKKRRNRSQRAGGAADNVELGLLGTPAASGANTPMNGLEPAEGVAPQAVVLSPAQTYSHGSPAPIQTAHSPAATAPPPATAQLDGASNEHGSDLTPLPAAALANNDNIANPGVITATEWWTPSLSPLSRSRIHYSAFTGTDMNPTAAGEPSLAAPLAPLHIADDNEEAVNGHGTAPAPAVGDDDASEADHEHFLATDGFGHLVSQLEPPTEAGDDELPSYAAAVAAGSNTASSLGG